MTVKDVYCRNCGEEIYYSANGWIPGGEWRHYRNDKAWCAVSLVGLAGKLAEPNDDSKSKMTESSDLRP